MSYQYCLFDLYGTLADIHTDESGKKLWKCLALWYQSHGARYTAWEIKKEYERLVQEEKKQVHLRHPEFTHTDIKIEKIFQSLYSLKGRSVPPETAAETALYFRTQSRSYIRLYKGVRSMLSSLRTHGRKCYLLTNAQEVFTMPELHMLDIVHMFDGILISSCEECAKPDPHFFEAAQKRFGICKSESVMIGNDPYTDIAGACACGIASVYFHSNLSPQWTKRPQASRIIPDGSTETLLKVLLSDNSIQKP